MKKVIKKAYLKERCITPRIGKKGISFQVRVFIPEHAKARKNEIVESFSESKYGSAELAFKAAKIFRDKTEDDLKKSNFVQNADNLNIIDLLERKFELIPKSLATKEKHISYFNSYIKPLCGNIKIKELKASEIQLTLNSMINDKSQDTINCVFYLWKDLIKAAIIDDLIHYDLMLKIIVPKSKYVPKSRNKLSDISNVSKIIECLDNSEGKLHEVFYNKILAFAIKFMFYTGRRPSECYALLKSDVDFVSNSISINKRIGSNENTKNIPVPTKTAKSSMTIPISKPLRLVLEELFAFQPSERLFADFFGNYLDLDIVPAKINYIAKKNNIVFNMYMLRHGIIDLLRKNGIDERSIMDYVGHTNISTTMGYGNSNMDLLQETIKERKLH